eukprot:Rmarinus@m.7817
MWRTLSRTQQFGRASRRPDQWRLMCAHFSTAVGSDAPSSDKYDSIPQSSHNPLISSDVSSSPGLPDPSAVLADTLTETPTGVMFQFLDTIHDFSGLPWWATLASATILCRAALFPVYVKQVKATKDIQRHQPVLVRYNEILLELRSRLVGGDAGAELEIRRVHDDYLNYMRTHNVQPLKAFMNSVVQAPVFLCMFWTLRGFETLPPLGYSTGGTLWFENLTAADPTFALPVLAGSMMSGVMLLALKMQDNRTKAPDESQAMMNKMLKLFVFAPALFFPVYMKFSAGVMVYWVSNNMFSMSQVLFANSRLGKWALGLDKLPTTPPVDPASISFPPPAQTTSQSGPKRYPLPSKTTTSTGTAAPVTTAASAASTEGLEGAGGGGDAHVPSTEANNPASGSGATKPSHPEK